MSEKTTTTGWHMHGTIVLSLPKEACCPDSDRRPVVVLDPADPAVRETIARVLAEHGWQWAEFHTTPRTAECSADGCDWTWESDGTGDASSVYEAEREHLAAEIAAALAPATEGAGA